MKATAICILIVSLALPGCVMQKDLYPLDERIYLLEQQYSGLKQFKSESELSRAALTDRVKTHQTKQTQSMQQLRDQSAGIYADLEAVKAQVSQLGGRLEESEYSQSQKVSALQELEVKGDTRLQQIEQSLRAAETRLARLEQYLNIEPSTAATTTTTAGTQTAAVLSEEAMYRNAKQAFDQGNDEAARVGFQQMLKRYPKSPNADNAQFWIGEIFYREKWYEKAILEYQKVIEKYPKGNKVQAALLKQGLAFQNLKDKANARLILKELINKYPRSTEAKIARQKLKEF